MENHLRMALATLWLALSAALVVLNVIDYDAQARLYFSNALQVASSLLAALLCFRTYRAFPTGSPMSGAWGLVGGGVLAWSVGATIFGAYPLLHGGRDTPYPYYSDIFYLATSPLMAAGLLHYKRSTELVAPGCGKALAFVLLLVTGYWTYLANKEGLGEGGVALHLSSLGYMLADPVLLATTVLLASSFRHGAVSRAWWYVVAGTLLYIGANQLYTFLVLQGTYQTGAWIDVGWVLGFGLVAWAADTTRKVMY